MGLIEPVNVRWIATDLAAVSSATLEVPVRATWNWLGVTQYLDKPATESVLRTIAGRAPGTAAVVELLLHGASVTSSDLRFVRRRWPSLCGPASR